MNCTAEIWYIYTVIVPMSLWFGYIKAWIPFPKRVCSAFHDRLECRHRPSFRQLAMRHCCGDICLNIPEDELGVCPYRRKEANNEEVFEAKGSSVSGEGPSEDGNASCHHGQPRSPVTNREDTSHSDLSNGCCSDFSTISSPPKRTQCLGKLCCIRKLSSHTHHDSDLRGSESDEVKVGHEPNSTVVHIDDESPVQLERIVINVRGMTCTGCEANLRKVLKSMEGVSDVKTSLLLAQAEFRFKQSHWFKDTDVLKAIEQMTGFSCAKIVDTEEELDLALPVGPSRLEGPWPSGMTSMKSIGQGKIRISYMPKTIGARTLLEDPFFQSAQFAPSPTSRVATSGRVDTHKHLLLTAIAAVLTTPVLVLAYANLTGNETVYGGVSLVLATLVQLLAHGFYIRAYKTLRYSGMIEMDMLIVLSTSTAYVYSVTAYAFLLNGHRLSSGDYFETSTLLITLILVGRTAAAYSRQTAAESITIQSLQEETATIVDWKEPDLEITIDCRLLQYGDKFKVQPDTRIPTDGVILEGKTEVDESLITGETALRLKKPGMPVIAGSINRSGKLLVELTRLPSENTIRAISAMVDEAKSSKADVQQIADRVASYFTPVIIVITALVFVSWVVAGKSLRHESNTPACINAMTYAISTLIVSCPCAIGLAVPMVLVIAGGVGARHGLIFKSAASIEIGRKITHAIFDKTGTLTQGNLLVVDHSYLGRSERLPSLIMALTDKSKHPVSSGVHHFLESQGVKSFHLESLVSTPGKGVEAIYDGDLIRGGCPQWLQVEDSPVVQMLTTRNLTIFCVEVNGTLAAVFGLQDQLRPDAIETISELNTRNISVSLLSGDNAQVVTTIGAQIGISPQNIRYGCTPAQKAAYVKEQLATPNSTVLFCGDGTNDAIALAQASIGLHVNGGTDVAQGAADVVLMNSSLKRIITLIDLSKAFHRRLVFNFVWSFVYNVLAILLAAGAIPRARIPPAYAGLGELVSVLPVVLIAMQLRMKKF